MACSTEAVGEEAGLGSDGVGQDNERGVALWIASLAPMVGRERR